MDMDAIDLALHEISMMVSVALGAAETLSATDTVPPIFQMPDEPGELLSFSLFDIDTRVKTLKAALWQGDKSEPVRPVLTIVREPA